MQQGPDPAAATEAALGLQAASPAQAVPTVAVLPLRGLVMQHESIWTEYGFAFSTETLIAQVRALVADQAVKAIVLDIDSPGGGVYGVVEAAEAIRAARDVKPVIAVANAMAASAAYWIASAASEVVVTPSGDVGSIGVFAQHEDWSGWYEQQGIVPTIVKAGPYKAEFADSRPLSDEARAELQRQVDECYHRFLAQVAKGRGVPVATVEADFGGGRMLSAKAAVAAGMADRVGTVTDVLVQVARAAAKPAGTKAEAHGLDLDARRRRLRLAEVSG